MSSILVVDDDPGIREATGELLLAEGHEVRECTDGIVALAHIQADPPDLILLDLGLPGLSGESVAAMLKADEVTRLIPIVILTGDDDAATQCRLLELGVEEFLAKPFSRHLLLARIRSLLRSKSLNDQLLQAFRSVEAMESMSMEVIRRASEDPQNPGDLLRIALGRCTAGTLGPGAPTHLFYAREVHWGAEELVEGRTLWQGESGEVGRGVVSLPRRQLREALAPYHQGDGAYFALSATEAVRRRLWAEAPGSSSLAGVVEEGRWIFAGGYARPVGIHDTRWLASVARQVQLFGAHLAQVAATDSAFVYVMEALARAAETHEGDTGAHLRRVNGYSELIARRLGCPEAFVREIARSAMMHDVGKIHISREILLKPGPLDDGEMAMVRQHPKFGAIILGDSPKIAMAREIALCHHERWDGTGYPGGLRGDDIPLPARIVTLADIYDALRAVRSYKGSIGHEEAMRILLQGDQKTQPRHFDPACLAAAAELDTQLDGVFKKG